MVCQKRSRIIHASAQTRRAPAPPLTAQAHQSRPARWVHCSHHHRRPARGRGRGGSCWLSTNGFYLAATGKHITSLHRDTPRRDSYAPSSCSTRSVSRGQRRSTRAGPASVSQRPGAGRARADYRSAVQGLERVGRILRLGMVPFGSRLKSKAMSKPT